MVGLTLDHYKVLEPLGAGGMGEVYRAHDTKLKRDVAIKVIPEDWSADEERLARLEGEARLLATLSHPNIGAIYGLEDADGVRFMVLELIAGETLAKVISRRQIEVEEALGLARQIAEALEAAHAKAIIHRDLKPGNVMITPEGQVKVLDFGLAKSHGATAAGDGVSEDVSESPTVAAATMAGVILGTAAYMSPEQARAKPLDKRTDIWSFGCVLYEMLSGRRPFEGSTVSDTLAAILRAEPDWDLLPQATPRCVRTLLRRCLAKDPKRRVRDMGDVWLELEEAPEQMALEQAAFDQLARTPVAPVRRALPWALFALAAMVAFLGIWSPWRDGADPLPSAVRLSVTLPEGHALDDRSSGLALSPDGNRLVLSIRQGGARRLFWRRIGSFELNEIPGTEGAIAPFFSPDSEWVGFSVPAERELKRVLLSGGSPQTICACEAADASWGEDGTIVFAGYPRANLFRTSIAGDEPEPVTRTGTNFENDEIYHMSPQVLPGGTHVMFTATSVTQGRIVVVSLETGERTTLIEGGVYGRYLPTGHIVYVLPPQGDLLAVSFDLERLEVEGTPVPLLGGIGTDRFGNGSFAVSETGVLAYVPGSPGYLNKPAWVGDDGNVEQLPFSPGFYQSPRVAPDGERLSVTKMNEGDVSMWLLDPSRATSRRLTPEATSEFWQIWHPGGGGIVANSLSGDGEAWEAGLYLYPVDSSAPETLFYGGTPQPSGWTPDGRTLLFQDSFGESPTGFDILALQLDGDGKPTPIVATHANEAHPVLSPDGRWLAYVSDESGRYEVFVRSYPDRGALTQVSSNGGFEPLWSPDGRQLYYRREDDGGTILAVSILGETTLEVGRPRMLFELTNPDGSTRFEPGTVYGRNYDLAPDGRRFLMLQTEPELPIRQVNLVLNWFEELRQQVPREQ